MIKWLRVKFMDWRISREVKAHEAWVKRFDIEYAKQGSKLNAAVIERAVVVATGMVMRWMDDKGIRRCAFCISTDQLEKRVVEAGVKLPNGKITNKVVFVCGQHRWKPLKTEKEAVNG